jgi:hypothetical protein
MSSVSSATTADVGLLVVGGAASAGALSLEAGPVGVVIALLGIAVAYVWSGFYGVAVHHLGAVGLVEAPGLPGLVLLEAAAVFLLVADAPPGDRLLTGTLAVPAAIVLGVTLATVAGGRGYLAAALVLVLVVAIGTYATHRYARVRLGLAAGELDS